MKKLIFICMMCCSAFMLFSENVQDDFLGAWVAEPFLAEQSGKLLLDAEADYAFPYLGIREFIFYDSGLASFKYNDRMYRAFYEVDSLDFNNIHISFMLKTGDELLLKLADAGDGTYKFIYRITDGMFDMPDEEDDRAEEDRADGYTTVDTTAAESAASDKGRVSGLAPAPAAMGEPEEEQLPVSTFTGIIRRK